MSISHSICWKDAPTKSVEVDGTKFAFRELGPNSRVPVIFLNHLAAELDWDLRVVDGIAKSRRVIVFDNRGIGASKGSTPKSVEDYWDLQVPPRTPFVTTNIGNIRCPLTCPPSSKSAPIPPPAPALHSAAIGGSVRSWRGRVRP